MLSKIHLPTECACRIEYDGDWRTPSKVEGKVCDVHKEAGMDIVEAHASHVALARERGRLNTEIHKLAENTPEMKDVYIETDIGVLRLADVADAQAYPEDKYPRKILVKKEYNPVHSLKEDGSFDVKLPETDKKSELEAALSK